MAQSLRAAVARFVPFVAFRRADRARREADSAASGVHRSARREADSAASGVHRSALGYTDALECTDWAGVRGVGRRARSGLGCTGCTGVRGGARSGLAWRQWGSGAVGGLRLFGLNRVG